MDSLIGYILLAVYSLKHESTKIMIKVRSVKWKDYFIEQRIKCYYFTRFEDLVKMTRCTFIISIILNGGNVSKVIFVFIFQ